MIMARRGTHEFFGFSMVGVFFAVLLLSVYGNCACRTGNGNYPCQNKPSSCSCEGNATSCPLGVSCTRIALGLVAGCSGGEESTCSKSAYGGYNAYLYCNNPIICDTQCEADSVACQPPSVWDSENCECKEQCEEEECAEGEEWDPDSCKCVADICAPDRIECRNAGGSWSGAPDGDCCSSVCDLCNSESVDRLFEQKKRECCAQLKAPPGRAEMCLTPLQSGCGMTTSTLSDDNNEFKCRDPNLGGDAHDSYFLNCSGSSSSTEQSSSSYECEGDTCQNVGSSSSECEGDTCQTPPPGPGSSSDGVNSSDSFGPGSSDDGSGCPECGILLDIRDTLHFIHVSINDIYSCISSPYLCNSSSTESNPFRFDTAFRFYLEPIMDSALKLDNQQLKALLRLDTNQLKMLKVDSVALRNDTLLGYKVDALGNVIDTSIHSLNDSTRKWFSRIADSIGISTDSLIAHLDSIVRNIPDSILDSIVKYQAYANDNLDSVLYGKGKGFSLVDSLIDSTVKYFKRATYFDSVYSLIFSDSIGNTNSLIDGLPSRNASAISRVLGYGDTAATDLRGDLNGIREAIEGLGDTSGLGSSVGGGGNGSGADTSGYGAYVSTMSGRYAALAKNAAGGAWGDSATLETVFASDSSDTTDVDSASERDNGFLLDSAQAMLNRGRDSLLRDTSLLAAYYDTLKTEMLFFNFDSLLIQPLREALPAVTSCPEDCFKGDLQSGTMPHVNTQISVNYNLCRKWPAFGDADIFMIFRVLLRIITAITCIYIGAWYIANRKI